VTPEAQPTFALAVLGCRANQAEVDALRSHLLARGAIEVPYPGPADICIVNTCAVTASAQAQSRQAIRRACGVPGDPVVIATGCGAQLDPEVYARIAGVGHVVGNAAKSGLPDLIDRYLTTLPSSGRRPPDRGVVWDPDPTSPRFLERSGPVPRRRTRALLKVQDGCDQACTYCIVGRLRGRPVSRDPRRVLDEARRLVSAGFRELVLTGVNLGLYGLPAAAPGGRPGPGDHGPFVRLLAQLAAIEGLERIRLSSIEPMLLTDELIDAWAASGRLAPSLHLPLQSGDRETLRRMGRPYDADDLRSRVARLSRALGVYGLGADVIAGFPGESEAAFERTLALLEELPVTYLHAFAYSERPGTPAAELGGRVPPRVRKERVSRLRALDERLRSRFQARLQGRRCRVLIERSDGEAFEGFSGEYVRMCGRAAGASCGAAIAVTAGASLGPRLQQCDPVETNDRAGA
jgi:threonylcarbamoyladenosine tRNA methylthiotransferase MtaB